MSRPYGRAGSSPALGNSFLGPLQAYAAESSLPPGKANTLTFAIAENTARNLALGFKKERLDNKPVDRINDRNVTRSAVHT
jgi:hypothetical protein